MGKSSDEMFLRRPGASRSASGEFAFGAPDEAAAGCNGCGAAAAADASDGGSSGLAAATTTAKILEA